MSNYLVYQVGCIECGVSSYPVGVYDTKEAAESGVEAHPDTWETEGGDGFLVIVDLHTLEQWEV